MASIVYNLHRESYLWLWVHFMWYMLVHTRFKLRYMLPTVQWWCIHVSDFLRYQGTT